MRSQSEMMLKTHRDFSIFLCSMFSRATWTERNGKKVMDAVPSNWIIEDSVYWPSARNALKYIKSRATPDLKMWQKFPLQEVSFTSGKSMDIDSHDCIRFQIQKIKGNLE